MNGLCHCDLYAAATLFQGALQRVRACPPDDREARAVALAEVRAGQHVVAVIRRYTGCTCPLPPIPLID